MSLRNADKAGYDTPYMQRVRQDHQQKEHEVDRARLAVCDHAQDTEDARELLDMLGLLPDKDEE